jgi:hypothetical protein
MSLSYFSKSFGLLCLLFVACKSNDHPGETEDLVEVAYIVPVYETASQLSARVSVDPAKDYAAAGKIITYQNYIFINRPNEGIHVVDNSNPQQPINLHFITLPGSLDMAVIDDHLYADMYSALVVIDISEVTQPQIMEEFTVEDVFYYNPYENFPEELDLSGYNHTRYEPIENDRGIVTSWEIEIREEPISEEELRYVTLEMTSDVLTVVDDGTDFNQTSSAGSMTRFLPIDRFLYTINFNELILFEIDDNHQPNRFARLDTRTQAETLFQLNDFLFVGSTTGMLMYDVTSPANPEYLNSIDHFRSCDPVVADEAYAYVTLRGGTNCFTQSNELQIIDIQNPAELSVVARQVLYNPHGLALWNEYLLVCDGAAGLKIINVSDRENPEIIASENIPFAYDIIIDYPNAMIVGESVLYQFDISNLPEITQTAELPLSANE